MKPSAYVSARLNGAYVAKALLDSGCEYYAVIDEDFANRTSLPLIDTQRRVVKPFSDDSTPLSTRGVVVFDLDIQGFTQKVFAHIVQNLGQDLFLGDPFMAHNRVIYDANAQRFRHGRGGFSVRLENEPEPDSVRALRDHHVLSVRAFTATCRQIKSQKTGGGLYAVSIDDVEKALRGKAPVKPEDKIPARFLGEFRKLFDAQEASKLPPHRLGIDHEVNLQRDSSGEERPLPWGPLYSMSREELLVLKKTLTDLLQKGYIRPSSSDAAAPVLFVKKPGGGLRFCCDYRALNAITQKDRYPLPLISETLRSLAKAKFFTKLDVVAAFHKLRMAPGHEKKTAFRTRYGSFEWLVCPFGLSGAPAAFQRYINTTLGDLLDEGASAYMDDILCYAGETRSEHDAFVRRVLQRLQNAGLSLDPAKCEFGVKSTKYLGFIIRAGEGIACDPDKQRAISEWKPPETVKGVQSFLGFANYYRTFIPEFAKISIPLADLTRKDTPFVWTHREQAAFQLLKQRFTQAPVLRDWDPDRPTYLEADCSGFAVGGVLSQEDSQKRRYAVAFFSQRLNSAECNYPIHDKELLAIIKCLKAWRGELRSCERFTILSDHHSLKFFMTKRELSERQARWSTLLSEYNFDLVYRPGREAVAPDALSRREQDQGTPGDNPRIEGRYLQLLTVDNPQKFARVNHFSTRPKRREHLRVLYIEDDPGNRINDLRATTPLPLSDDSTLLPDNPDLRTLWKETLLIDKNYQRVVQAITQRERRLPPEVSLKINLSECEVDLARRLRFRGRL